jgi:crossover junction endodeoxyribonuclease RuvC
MKILGIDPGLNITGYGILETANDVINIIEAGVIRPDTKMSTEMRLLEIGNELGNIINQHNPDVVAVEELYSHYGHPRTAIIMGHARGVIFLKAAEANLPVFPYASTKVKNSLTGNGRASKEQVQLMICSTLNMKDIPEPPDVADALAVALCHIRTIQHQKVTGL